MENKMSSFDKITEQDFAQYHHGLAYVSSVDGRGNFIVFGIFRKHGSGRYGRKRLYSFVGLLCYSSGEFRDGFVEEGVTENDIFSLVQHYLDTAHKSIPLVKVPAEDVAAFVITFCHDKSKKKKLEIPNDEVQKGIELFKEAGKYFCYKNTNDYVIQKVGAALKEPKFYHLDQRRREFQSWWMDRPEMKHMDLPLPPSFPSIINNPKTVLNKAILDDAGKWLHKVYKKLHNDDNYERFAGMVRHMGFWYINSSNSSNLKLAATMLQSYDRILDCKRNGKQFDSVNILVALMVSLTWIKLCRQGLCEGQTKRPVTLETTRNTCNMCGAPVQKGEADNDLTCVNAEGQDCLGDETLRDVLSIVFENVKKYGVPKDALRAIKHVFAKALSVFFTHCFRSHLYWKEVPTPLMIDKLVEESSVNLLRRLIMSPIDNWKESTCNHIRTLMKTHCGAKLSDTSIDMVSNHFLEVCRYICPKDNNLNNNFTCSCISRQSKVFVLIGFVLQSLIGKHLKLRWNFISEERRKRILECGMETINEALLSIYRSSMLMFLNRLNAERERLVKENATNNDSSNKQNEKKTLLSQICINKSCACHNFSKFKEFFISYLPVITGGEKSILQWKKKYKEQPRAKEENENEECKSEGKDDQEKKEEERKYEKENENTEDEQQEETGGKLMLNHNLFLSNDNDILSDIICGEDATMLESIEKSCDAVPQDCPRLKIITETACYRLYLALKSKIIQEYKEVPLQVDYCPVKRDYWRPRCSGCLWEENNPDRFMLCGGCKEVYYCSQQCQRRHWIADHRKECKKIIKYNQPAKEIATKC